MSPRVASGHPPQELSVVDDEIAEGELVRVEKEGSDAKTEHGDPEVDQMWHPDRQSDIQEEDKRSYTKVDRRSGKSRAVDVS